MSAINFSSNHSAGCIDRNAACCAFHENNHEKGRANQRQKGQNFKERHQEFFADVENEEKTKIREKFPQPTVEKEAEFVEAMFPKTGMFAKESFDRILMSWSWSAHMLGDMTEDELVNTVWPELDRLLAQGGIANIFPIGHHGVSPEWVADTLTKYIDKSGAKWEFDLERTVSHVKEDANYKLLQIRKL